MRDPKWLLAFGVVSVLVLHELGNELYVLSQFCQVHPVFCFEPRRRPYNWPTKEELEFEFGPTIPLPGL
jgi:hypothetical protein